MYKKIFKSIIITGVVVMLFSCENSMTSVQEFAKNDTLPLLSAYNIEYERTDSGYLQVILKSPLMQKFEGKDPYVEFPEGFEVTFYNDSGEQVSYMRANYGINYEKQDLIRARNDVVVINFEKEEELRTENLVWDKKKKIIYSNTFVKITAPDKVIYGDSMWANESFSKREIIKFKADIDIEEDSVTAK
ncbi:MAG: LPS export ABC transporter periplasmic protein LptC [Bacteroidetes bacterium]|nr:MAG: LPS export ABC transporter periplasmic protein LptC [Bacteroidota bacterium]